MENSGKQENSSTTSKTSEDAFEHILHNTFLRRCLRQFLRKSNEDLNRVNFWLEMNSLSLIPKEDKQQWQLALVGIHNRFIKKGSTEPIPISEDQRNTFVDDLSKQFDITRIAALLPDTYKELKSKVYEPFINSEEYKEAMKSAADIKNAAKKTLTSSGKMAKNATKPDAPVQAKKIIPPGSSRTLMALQADGRTLTSLLDHLPLKTKLKTPKCESATLSPKVFGPSPFPVPSDFIYSDKSTAARIASTYPVFGEQGKQYGSPTADSIGIDIYDDCMLFAIADGCGWGEGSAHAAQQSVKAFLKFLSACRADFVSVENVSNYLVQALNEAHSAVLQRFRSGIGTTTLLGGVLVRAADGRLLTCYISIGDCKLFCLRQTPSDWTVTELPNGKRSPTNLNDPGGRIGITDESDIKGSLPDVRNLFVGCEEITTPTDNAILLLVSDGVHDNFNPSALGKTLKEVYGDRLPETYKNWSDVPEIEAITEATKYRERSMRELFLSKKVDTLDGITSEVIQYCVDTTQPARLVMEQGKRAPDGHGKMDHASLLVLRTQI